MLVLKNPILQTLLIFTLFLSVSLPRVLYAQGSTNTMSNYMGTIALDIQYQPLPAEMSLDKDQSLMVISFGPELAQRIMDNPIKYASPVRIWLSKASISPSEAYFYVNKPSHELIFSLKSSDMQTLILSGLADFSSTRKNMAFEKGMFYAITIEIEKMPNEMPTMDVAMNPKTTYLFEQESMNGLASEAMNKERAKWYKFAWVKPVAQNKYVKWGARIVAVSAASYFGYQHFLAPGDGNSLPLPPSPPQ